MERKTDKDDALKLARLALMKQLTPVHVPKQEVREHRTLVKYRKTLDQRIDRVKNSVRYLFANRGIQIANGQRAWYTGRARIDSFRKPLAECALDELWRGQLDVELTQLDSLAEQLAEVERHRSPTPVPRVDFAPKRNQANQPPPASPTKNNRAHKNKTQLDNPTPARYLT